MMPCRRQRREMQTIMLTAAHLVFINPLLATAGFYPASTLPQPTVASDTTWARYTNATGLIAGQTRLGKLGLLYTWTQIAGSVFSNMTAYVWDGTRFSSN
jgi:hypothetical protein